ncbi:MULTISPECIES: hypothetical protein [Vibrio]|uniref:hypothetical protein n=1 Tax=Vibrio TaxID=662 RepID=UPI0006A75ABD|nr:MULTISPECIES: hypothetical protein [Vibrio]PNP28738.1 hypothetical protein AL471_003785 [Vibrio alginolyticus]USD76969.1 hypothetical protein J4N43_18345 [Vibrio sp. SCSIO 43009]
MKSNKSKSISLISVVVFVLAIAALKFENTLGVLPIVVAIIAFFTCVVYTSRYLSDMKRSELISQPKQARKMCSNASRNELDACDKKR